MSADLKAPFPYFGGKRPAAKLIWQRLGNVPHYVEPFAGSLAAMLARPHAPGSEIVNDANGWVANAWRAIAKAPDEVAEHCDRPVIEVDVRARHKALQDKPQEGAAGRSRRASQLADTRRWVASLGVATPTPFRKKGGAK